MFNIFSNFLSYYLIFQLNNFKRIGYSQIKITKIFVLSILVLFGAVVIFTEFFSIDCLIDNKFIFVLIFVLSYFVFDLVQLWIDYNCPGYVFRYLHTSVKNNNIDNCIWCACTSGQLIKIITKSNEEFIVFPKYSSSFDCKLTSKKYLRAFILKKGIIDNNGKVEYYEDNTRQILQSADLLIQRNNDQNFLFEEFKTDSTENKRFSLKFYPKVPLYQILSEFEDRIDFKDIASISIYHLPNTNSEGNKND